MVLREDASSRDSGYTLLETLVVTIILGMILAMTTAFISGATRTFSRETRGADLQADLAGSMSVLLDDLSIAGYGVNAATNPFVDANANNVTFEGNVNSAGVVERICYSLSGGNLQRSVQDTGQACGTSPAQTLATNVQSFGLTYLGQVAVNGTTRAALTEAEAEAAGKRCTSAAPSGPCFVQVAMVVQAAAKGGNVTKSIAGEAAIRN